MVFHGFLQYIGIAFFLLSSLYVLWPPVKRRKNKLPFTRRPEFCAKALVVVGLVCSGLLLTFYLHAPGCSGQYFTPGGIVDGEKYSSCTGGANGLVDRAVFGEDHIPQDPACKYLYGCSSFTRYGLLGILNFCFVVYLGMVIGDYFLDVRQFKKRVQFTFVVMAGCTCLAASLTFFFKPWPDNLIPMVKGMWSLSFVFLSNAITCALFFFFYTIHEKKITNGWPFRAVGLNAIFIYVLYSVLGNRFPFGFENSGTHMKMILSNLMCVSVWLLVSVGLHKYRFYVKY